MSALLPYGRFSQISGARYAVVPMTVWAACPVSRTLEMPKSPSLVVPDFMRKMFWHLMSRCRIRLSWMYCSPSRQCPNMVTASAWLKFSPASRRLFTSAARSPPSANWRTMCSIMSSTKASKYAMMCGYERRLSTSTSACAPLCSESPSMDQFTRLMTHSIPWRPPLTYLARLATPNAPRPSSLITSNCSMPVAVSSSSAGTQQCTTGISRHSSALGRLSGCFSSTSRMSSWASSLYSSGMGGGSAVTIFMTRAAMLWDSQGSCRLKSSWSTTPVDQMSALWL
mmetsp:Transcript_24636/g.69261  ORF Transcript_24636/g.69261 Transcript_24636/m.69261 type:complete len:283 (-) Transcript_24636:118-966(-)